MTAGFDGIEYIDMASDTNFGRKTMYSLFRFDFSQVHAYIPSTVDRGGQPRCSLHPVYHMRLVKFNRGHT